jgi:hypothetical protein
VSYFHLLTRIQCQIPYHSRENRDRAKTFRRRRSFQRISHQIPFPSIERLEDLGQHVHHNWHLHSTILHIAVPAYNSERVGLFGESVAADDCTIAGSYFADKAGQRGIFLLGFQAVAIIGFLMLVTNDMPNVQYAGTFFAAAGEWFAGILVVCG